MTTVFDSSNGCTYAVLEMGDCRNHGKYPVRIQQVDKETGCLSHYPLRFFCPLCKKEESEMQLFGEVAIPPRFAGKTFDNFVPTEKSQKVFDYFKDYSANFADRIESGTSVILTGCPGTGKTHLACALLYEAKKQGYSVRFTNVRKLVRSVRDTWKEGAAESESQVIDRYIDLDLLVIDEVGVQAKSENEQHIIFDVLNGRYENVKPTIILSNEDLATIREIIGERAYDRLREGGGKAFAFDWDSYRPRAQLPQPHIHEQNSFKFYDMEVKDDESLPF